MSLPTPIPSNLYEMYVMRQYTNNQVKRAFGYTSQKLRSMLGRAGIEYRKEEKIQHVEKVDPENSLDDCKISFMSPEDLAVYQRKTKNNDRNVRSI